MPNKAQSALGQRLMSGDDRKEIELHKGLVWTLL